MCPCGLCGMPMRALWDAHAASVGCPCGLHVMPMRPPRGAHGSFEEDLPTPDFSAHSRDGGAVPHVELTL